MVQVWRRMGSDLARSCGRWFIAACFLVASGFAAIHLQAVSAAADESAARYEHDPSALVAAYRHVEVASVSDAIEQLYHERKYLSHRMQPPFAAKFAGYAVTVRLDKEESSDP